MAPTATKKSSFPANLKLMAGNLVEVVPPGTISITIDGTPQKVTAIEAGLQVTSDLSDKVIADTEALREARAALKAALPEARKLFLQVATYLRLTLGPTSASLAKVGVSAHHPKAKPTTQTRSEADAKRKATIAAGGRKAVKVKAVQAAAEATAPAPAAVPAAK